MNNQNKLKTFQIKAFLPNMRSDELLKIELLENQGSSKVEFSGFGAFNKSLEEKIKTILFLSGHKLSSKTYQVFLNSEGISFDEKEFDWLQLPVFLLFLESLGELKAGADLSSMSASGKVLQDGKFNIPNMENNSKEESLEILNEYLYGFGLKNKITSKVQ